MLIDFNDVKEMTIPGMNKGTGMMTVKMYMDEQVKIIPCAIHIDGFIGLHKYETSDDINYVLSDKDIAICDGKEEKLTKGVRHICKKVLNIASLIQEMRICACLQW